MPQRSKTTRRRIAAVLAGGLVLGVGATATLAAWNDSQFATGTFGAGTFNLEGTLDGTTWNEHPTTGDAAVLDFTLDAADLAPGDVVYAPFAVRLDEATTSTAELTVAVAGTTGTVTGLSYELLQPAAFGCDGATTGTSLVPAGTALDASIAPARVALSHGAPDLAGAPAFLCFIVTADTALMQGQTGSTTWQFVAEST